jgi:hypothetical protein
MEQDTDILPDKTDISWLDQIIEIANNITRRLIKQIEQDNEGDTIQSDNKTNSDFILSF